MQDCCVSSTKCYITLAGLFASALVGSRHKKTYFYKVYIPLEQSVSNSDSLVEPDLIF